MDVHTQDVRGESSGFLPEFGCDDDRRQDEQGGDGHGDVELRVHCNTHTHTHTFTNLTACLIVSRTTEENE